MKWKPGGCLGARSSERRVKPRTGEVGHCEDRWRTRDLFDTKGLGY